LLSAHPGEVESLRRKDSRQINILEQILVAKVFNFGGICSSAGCEKVGTGFSQESRSKKLESITFMSLD
jgi:hypothetical protein